MRLYSIDGKFNITGGRIREARTRAGLSQEQLATRLQLAGLTLGQMAISRIGTGKRIVPDYELLFLADALGVTVGWLLGQCK